jgi:hypothetical protein
LIRSEKSLYWSYLQAEVFRSEQWKRIPQEGDSFVENACWFRSSRVETSSKVRQRETSEILLLKTLFFVFLKLEFDS